MKRSYKVTFRELCVAALLAGVLPCANAAVSTGCDNDNNAYIMPELALCSTHAYNIGASENPDNDAQKQVMKEVVALKTTVMTQQMYKQYEYLESMVKRFKTQLEKAVLTTKLEAAGASPEGSSSGGLSFKSGDANIKLAGAQNCMTTTSFQNAYSCLSANIQLVLNAVNGGNNIGEAKRQLETDLNVATTWQIICKTDKQYGTDTDKDGKCMANLNYCNNLSNNRTSIVQCAQQFNVAVARALDSRQQKQNMQNWNGQARQ